jgi:predicted dehydrogenase
MSVGGDDRVIITPWRHLKDRGGIAFDMGVHYTDIFQYLLGPFESVTGFGFVAEKVRHLRDGGGSIEATAEDSLVATFCMASGVAVQLSQLPSGPGMRWYQRTVHGRNGSLEIPQDRRGGGPVLRLGERTLRGKELFSILPGFALDEITAQLFGADAAEYEMPFPEADRRHIAIELHDFASAVLTGGAPEVDGEGGLTAVAALLGVFESGLLRRTVSMDELLDGRVSAYQAELDRK